MRIAVISNTAWYLVNFRLNLMRALQAAGYTVVAIAPIDDYAQRIKAAGIEFVDVPISGSGTNPIMELKSVVALWRVLRSQRVDLVLSYTPKGNLYSSLACIALGISFIPNVSGLGRAFIRRSIITLAARMLYRATFKRAYRVFFQNFDDMHTFIKSNFVRAGNADRLPGSGVDLLHFSQQAPAKHDTDAPVFLLVARMLWDKGIGEYVEAARQVRMLHPKARFQLLGFLDVANPSAISRAQIDAWVSEGVVEYLGSTDDVRPFLTQADCVVLPSYREGVPRTLLEAAATARPVITSDAPGCRDTVIDGQTGFLCRPADAKDLTEKLLRFITLNLEQRNMMRKRGRSFVEENFNEKMVIERYLSLIQKIPTGSDTKKNKAI
jgi:glycosyltransferase involved in cell wall biosynthesis